MNATTHFYLLCQNPFVFLRILRMATYGVPHFFRLKFLPFLGVLVAQLGIVIVGILAAAGGLLEPTISADTFSVDNVQRAAFIVLMVAAFLVTLAAILVISATAWWDWCHFVARKQSCQAQKCSISIRQKWPWCAQLVLTKSDHEESLYKYKPVRNGEIRLLRVTRPGPTKRFECELVPILLEYRPICYLAASYTWGESPATKKVWFQDNQFIEVTDSVEILLDAVLEQGNCIHLWIDSICINQMDFEERSQQVLLMRDIYRYAQQVVINLREANSATNEAMEFIVPLQNAMKKISHPRFGSSLVSRLDVPRLAEVGVDFSMEPWTALGDLFSKAWWNRIWVIQEAAIGTDPVFICGDRAVEWDAMVYVINEVMLNGTLAFMFARYPQIHKKPRVGSIKAATHLTQIAATRIQIQRNRLPSFQDTLMEMVGYNATNPRDKIYGLLGLSNDADDEVLKPDYRLSERDVYIKTARHLLTKNQSILILHRAGISNSQHIPDLPSWVPDWYSQPASKDSLCFGKGWATYHASGSIPPRTTFNEDTILVINGVLVDTLVEVSALKEEYAEKLRIDGKLQSATQPDGESRFLDLEDERKITVEWVRQHQQIMFKTFTFQLSHDIKLLSRWKRAYKRTILAVDPLHSMQAPSIPEFDHIWNLANGSSRLAESDNILAPKSHDAVAAEQNTVFHQRFMTATQNRRFFMTKKRRIGIGSADAMIGDLVVVFLGGSTPFVIRPEVVSVEGGSGQETRQEGKNSTKYRYKLIGEAYVDGLMSGKAVDGLQEMDERIVQFSLI